MVRTKVFVGNLSFNTKENELAKEFEAAGKVISANIITRGPRSLGYGFVEMDNEKDAENAVKMLDKKEIDGRPINVEVAKPREEGADAAQQAAAQGKPRRAPRKPRNPTTPDAPAQQSGDRPPRQPRRSDQPRPTNNQGGNAPGRRPANAEGAAPRKPRVRPEGTPSTTTLFVANLPFSVEDDAFAKILKDASLPYKTAHVVQKKKTGRSKGFGFIEFENEGDQQKALAALNNKEIEGRALAVKVALTELRTGDATATSPAPVKASSSPAPAKSSPAPVKTPSKDTAAPVKSSTPGN